MDNLRLLLEKYPEVRIVNNKIFVNDNLYQVLLFLKNCPEFSFDILLSIIAVDYIEYVELIYLLYSTELNEKIMVYFNSSHSVPSIVNIYPCAYFDECEIFDLFGVDFLGNKKLKRILMPESWIGHPLRKSYELNDERLSWNE